MSEHRVLGSGGLGSYTSGCLDVRVLELRPCGGCHRVSGC